MEVFTILVMVSEVIQTLSTQARSHLPTILNYYLIFKKKSMHFTIFFSIKCWQSVAWNLNNVQRSIITSCYPRSNIPFVSSHTLVVLHMRWATCHIPQCNTDILNTLGNQDPYTAIKTPILTKSSTLVCLRNLPIVCARGIWVVFRHPKSTAEYPNMPTSFRFK